jgi:FkbM family methyltransferase
MIRATARAAARLLPEPARAALAQRRFGYSAAGSNLLVTCEPRGRALHYCVEDVPVVVPESAAADARFHFVENGDSRAEMAAFIRMSRASRRDALLLDVGAHKGLFSLVHLASGPQHRALLLEPSTPLASESRALLDLNGSAARADVRCCAAGDADELRPMVTDALGFARGATADDRDAAEVPVATIDRLCETSHVWPAIIKIDVEGAEGAVLRGARRTLLRCRPALCLELHLDLLERAGEDIEAILHQLEGVGYNVFSTTGRRVPTWQLTRSLKAILRIVATCTP